MEADIWIAKARLVCAGCEDMRDIKKEITHATFEEAVQAFAERHADCARQGKLEGMKR